MATDGWLFDTAALESNVHQKDQMPPAKRSSTVAEVLEQKMPVFAVAVAANRSKDMASLRMTAALWARYFGKSMMTEAATGSGVIDIHIDAAVAEGNIAAAGGSHTANAAATACGEVVGEKETRHLSGCWESMHRGRR